jgi:hypothetical protein
MIHLFNMLISSPLIDNNTIRSFSGELKRVYRVLIADLFCSSFLNEQERFLNAKRNLDDLYLKLVENDF